MEIKQPHSSLPYAVMQKSNRVKIKIHLYRNAHKYTTEKLNKWED